MDVFRTPRLINKTDPLAHQALLFPLLDSAVSTTKRTSKTSHIKAASIHPSTAASNTLVFFCPPPAHPSLPSSLPRLCFLEAPNHGGESVKMKRMSDGRTDGRPARVLRRERDTCSGASVSSHERQAVGTGSD